MNIFLLVVPVILSTVIWPINRWVMQNGGRGDAYGFWISLSGALTAGGLGLAFGQSYANPTLWLIAFMVGVAFSVGFCLIISTCLKIGPTGPTVAANNMGLVGPVVAGLLWPTARPFTLPIGFGIALVIVALAGFGASSSSPAGSQQAITPRWALLVSAGWLFAATSMTGQYFGSVLVPNHPLTLVSAFFCIATLILLPFMVRRGGGWFRKNELLGGIANGVLQASSISITLLALQRMGTQIVFPVTVLGPLIAILLLSALAYKERLSRLAWAACLSGLAGLALLALGS